MFKKIIDFFVGVFKKPKKEKKQPVMNWQLIISEKKGKGNMIPIQLNTEQQVTATINPVTPKGRPAPIDGVPVWSVVSGACTLGTVSDDGKTAVLLTPDEVPTADPLGLIAVEADADVGEGVETIRDTIEITVVSPRATSLGLSLGTPEPKP